MRLRFVIKIIEKVKLFYLSFFIFSSNIKGGWFAGTSVVESCSQTIDLLPFIWLKCGWLVGSKNVLII